MSDGRVVIDTELDVSGVNSGISKLSGKFVKIGKVGTAALKGTVAAVSATSVAIGGLVAKSTQAYSSYEQLVGGVDTLFKKSSKKVQEYANQAYKTAGLSSNEYMETVTSFSATLLQGLGGDTEKASKKANKAIIDMSDNANKMGTDMKMIQNAYQGFAKGNFTMLDNLKLGYGGTKTEMARLINDTKVLGDTLVTVGKGGNFDQVVTFDKMIEAIHKVQGELGITGTTSKEAATTIEGSVNSMKASFENLLVGIASGENVDELLDILIDNIGTAYDNVKPVVITSLGKILEVAGNLIENKLPEVMKEVPNILQELVGSSYSILKKVIPKIISTIPGIINSAGSIISSSLSPIFGEGVGKSLNNLVSVISSNLMPILSSLWSIIKKVALAISPVVEIILDIASFIIPLINSALELLNDNLDWLIPTITAVGVAMTAVFIAQNWSLIITSIISVVQSLFTVLLANPIMTIVAGVTALTAAIISYNNSSNEMTDKTRAQMQATNELQNTIDGTTERIDSLVSAYDNVSASSSQRILDIQAEYAQTETLWKELQKITDENGRIKQGYEDRAAYITGKLSQALGTEITIVDNQIQGYDKLQSSIQRTIAMKRLESAIDAKKEEYNKAKEQEVELAAAMTDAQKQYNQAEENFLKLTNEREKKLSSGQEVTKAETDAWVAAGDAYTKAGDNLSKVEEQYTKSQTIISNYDKALSSVGKSTKSMNKAYEDLATGFKKYGNVSKEALEQQADSAVKNLDKIKKAYESGDTNINKKQVEIAKKQAKKALTEYAKCGENTVAGYVKGINENSGDLSDAVVKMVNNALSAGNKAAKIKSPSRRTTESGKYLAQGWVKGFVEENPAKSIAKNVEYGMGTIQKAMNNDLKTSFSIEAESGFSNLSNNLIEALTSSNISIDVEGRQFGRLVRRYT